MVNGVAMASFPGALYSYKHAWSVPLSASAAIGDYAAVASFVEDGVTKSRLLEIVRIGDTRITGPLALDATVAKDSTVAKASDVLNAADFVAPDDSLLVQAIKDLVDRIPTEPVAVSDLGSLASQLLDIKDFVFGSIHLDKETRVMVVRRASDNNILKTFLVVDSATESSRS